MAEHRLNSSPMISRSRSAPSAAAMSIEWTTSANSTVTCLYSAWVSMAATGEPQASQNRAPPRGWAPQVPHGVATPQSCRRDRRQGWKSPDWRPGTLFRRDLVEDRLQRLELDGVERGQCSGRWIVDRVDLAHHLSAGVGQRDDLAPAIGRIGFANHQPPVLEVVDGDGGGGSIHRRGVRQLLDGQRLPAQPLEDANPAEG